MSNFSGITALLTVSLTAILTLNLLKDKFEVVENYEDMDYPKPPYGAQTDSTGIQQQKVSYNQNPDLGTIPKPPNNTPFVEGSGAFAPAFVSKHSHMYNTLVTDQAVLAAATPSIDQLNAIGGGSEIGSEYAPAFSHNSRANNLNPCSQNMNAFPGSAGLGISSSLLPNPNKFNKMEGFGDIDINNNPLANQAFLSGLGRIGTATVTQSNRNANQDLRSVPHNPVLSVSPWLNSTIGPDLTRRRPLEGPAPSFGLYGNGLNNNIANSVRN